MWFPEEEILSKMFKSDGLWTCTVCSHSSVNKHNVLKHVEAKHVATSGYNCGICQKFCSSLNALKLHESRYHKRQQYWPNLLIINTFALRIIHVFVLTDQVSEISSAVLSKMEQRGGVWGCLECNWESKYKSRIFDHVEAKHIETGGYSCTICGKFCPSYSSLKMHKSRYHRELKLT